MAERYIQRARLSRDGVRSGVALPYRITTDEVIAAAEQVHEYLHVMNAHSIEMGFDRFEETLLGNTFAGMLSELIVRAVANESSAVARNVKVGGHPDLIPIELYAGDSVLRGDDGVEVKASKQPGGWQGHNPEEAWLLVFQYAIDIETEPVEHRFATEIVKIMCTRVLEEHWSFSGRKGASRRTPTASILKEGTALLHASAIYERPGYVRNLDRLFELLRGSGS